MPVLMWMFRGPFPEPFVMLLQIVLRQVDVLEQRERVHHQGDGAAQDRGLMFRLFDVIWDGGFPRLLRVSDALLIGPAGLPPAEMGVHLGV